MTNLVSTAVVSAALVVKVARVDLLLPGSFPKFVALEPRFMTAVRTKSRLMISFAAIYNSSTLIATPLAALLRNAGPCDSPSITIRVENCKCIDTRGSPLPSLISSQVKHINTS